MSTQDRFDMRRDGDPRPMTPDAPRRVVGSYLRTLWKIVLFAVGYAMWFVPTAAFVSTGNGLALLAYLPMLAALFEYLGAWDRRRAAR